MIRNTKNKDVALAEMRPRSPRAPRALAAIGVLSGLVVAAWGSLGAVHTLYPSYVAAFVAPDDAETSETAALGTDAQWSDPHLDLILAAMTPAETPATVPAKPGMVPVALETGADTAPRLPLPAAPDSSPAELARRSAEEADTRASASLVHLPPEMPIEADPIAPEPPLDTPVVAAPTALPDTGDGSTLATLASPRPQPRPQSVTRADPARVTAEATAENDDTINLSTMNSASALAVLSSPRPRAVPQLVRAAFRPNQTAMPDTTAKPRAEPAAAPRTAPLISGNSCGRNHARAMPGRRPGAQTGSAFFAGIGNGSGGDRDNLIINELARGNMPGFLHNLQPVVFRGSDARGAATEIVICVTPDYLALGSDSDFVRVPLGLPAAASIAGRFGMMLPTSRMVDAIYAQASVKLSPAPMQAGPQMSSTAYFLRHNQTVEAQRGGRMGLISGHKKDVVMANRMAANPGRVAIYGWHRSNGNPIQPVSTVHGASYADYSHGIRLVSRTAYLNGRAVNLEELLSSSRYASILNSDGPLPAPVIRVASR